ncbi:hypothetical protein BEI67_19535 [Photobacterium damselae subsp. piscicida]|nr:hypothetical protein BEI67_19535 [Photobacterium damselae subsp. piscicida]
MQVLLRCAAVTISLANELGSIPIDGMIILNPKPMTTLRVFSFKIFGVFDNGLKKMAWVYSVNGVSVYLLYCGLHCK